MTATRIHAVCVALGIWLIPLAANAQEQPGYASSHFNPSERGSRWFVLDTLDMRGNGRIALGLVNDYSYRSLVDYNPDGAIGASIVRNQYLAHLGGAVTLADRFRLGLSVPLQLYADGHTAGINGITHRPAEDVAVGDVRVSADVRLFGAHDDAATMAAGVQLFLPAGSPAAYTGDGKPRVMPHVLFAGRSSSFVYGAKLGFLGRIRDEAFGNGQIGDALVYGVSGGMVFANEKLLVGPELFGSTVLSNGRAFDNRTSPLELLLGVHYDVLENIRVGAGVGTRITGGYGAPVARALLSLEWVPGDAVSEEAATSGDDHDGDGIPDCVDACAYAKGSKSEDPTKNGCPPPDADGDGIPDDVDACPRAAGPASTDPKANGCTGDADADGVLDPDDACPGVPGVRTNDRRTNGCPDSDRDHDGILDDVDACPDEPGKADPAPNKSGCPKAFLQGGSIKITDQVRFKNASAEIVASKDSEEVLQAVLAVLKAHAEIGKLRVEGHTDDRGTPEGNKVLSTARAAAVAKWLVDHGIAKERLTSEGFGSEKPLEPNTTDEARGKNRRVEFHVEQSGSGR